MRIDIGFLVNPFTIISFCAIVKISTIVMEVVKRAFQVGQPVYAKMKFWPPWPAIILNIKGFSARVQFFGWQNQW